MKMDFMQSKNKIIGQKLITHSVLTSYDLQFRLDPFESALN